MRLFWMKVPEPLEGAIRACRPHFLLAAILSALINILYLAPTIYMMQVYDRVVPTGGVLTLFWITIVVGVAIATLTALDAVRSRIMARVALRLNRMLSPNILERLMARQKIEQGAPATSQAMREFDTVRQALGGPAATALFDVPWTPLYLIVAFLIHPLLGVLVLAGGAILVALAVGNERRMKGRSNAAYKANALSYASQEATFRNAELVRALGMRRSLVAKHLRERGAGLQASVDVQFASGRYNALVKFARMFMQSIALGAGAYLAVKGQISVGAIIAASVLLSRALQPVEQLVAQWPIIIQSRQALHTLDRLFASTPAPDGPRTALPAPIGQLEMERVVVREPGGAVILKNVSLTLMPGTMLGVIGPSGAGKTTLARVAAGALPPDLGEVRIDGANFANWDAEALAPYIGYLPQNSGLLPGTVGENISRFAHDRGVDQALIDEQVIRAAQMAGVHEMILRLPDGYDTRLDDGARQLSAGQTQRVALARALYGGPRVLILDEPNSALDSDGEAALARALAAAKLQGVAIMIIAHRPAIIATAEMLLVLSDGAVARIGPRQQVLDELAAGAAKANVVPIHERA